MRRAVALHPTDFNYAHLAAKQAFHQSLLEWIPYFGSNTVPVDKVDPYAVRSGYAMSVVLGYDLRRKNLNCASLRKLTAEWRSVVDRYYGDYYPLTPYSLGEDKWIAWQFHRPAQGDGVVQAFRRTGSKESVKPLRLGGLDPAGRYEVTDTDAGTSGTIGGKELMTQGLPVEIKSKPGAVVVTYKTSGTAKTAR
jgi:alpha-galactosidase